MELTMRTDIYCPTCKKQVTYKAGFWASVFLSRMFGRLIAEGGTLEHEVCGTVINIPESQS